MSVLFANVSHDRDLSKKKATDIVSKFTAAALCHFNLDVSNHVMMLGAGKLNTHCSSTTVFVVIVTKERATGAPVPY